MACLGALDLSKFEELTFQQPNKVRKRKVLQDFHNLQKQWDELFVRNELETVHSLPYEVSNVEDVVAPTALLPITRSGSDHFREGHQEPSS